MFKHDKKMLTTILSLSGQFRRISALPTFWKGLKQNEKIVVAASSPTDEDCKNPEFLFYRAQGFKEDEKKHAQMLLVEALELDPDYEPARELLKDLMNDESASFKTP